MSMIINNKNIPFTQFENLISFQDSIEHFVTTRNSSFQTSASSYFTIGLNGVIDNATVLKNRKLIADQFSFTPDSYVFAVQVHKNKVAVVKDEDKGKGAFERSSYLSDIDAMITNHKGICIVTQAADCVPILFFDPVKRVIGCAHAGWKGTIAKISAEVVKTFTLEFGSNPKDLIVGIGPSIGPCCYEVGEEVVKMVNDTFSSKDGLIIENEKYSKPVFDLWEANKRTLIDSGVNPKNIELAELCTKCHNRFFFSARAGDKGRFGAGIILK
jgi:polyphenol oxidase